MGAGTEHSTLEVAAAHLLAAKPEGGELDRALVEEAVQHKILTYDRAGDEHYNVVSAFIKSRKQLLQAACLLAITR